MQSHQDQFTVTITPCDGRTSVIVTDHFEDDELNQVTYDGLSLPEALQLAAEYLSKGQEVDA